MKKKKKKERQLKHVCRTALLATRVYVRGTRVGAPAVAIVTRNEGHSAMAIISRRIRN